MAKPVPELVVYRGVQYHRDRLPADVNPGEVQSLDEWRKAARVVKAPPAPVDVPEPAPAAKKPARATKSAKSAE